MSTRYDTMMDPPVEELLDRTEHSKFRLVVAASTRARQINSYYGQLGDGLGTVVPPQVTTSASKPLSIAFEEIAADKIVPSEVDPEAEALAAAEAEAQAAADAAAAETDAE